MTVCITVSYASTDIKYFIQILWFAIESFVLRVTSLYMRNVFYIIQCTMYNVRYMIFTYEIMNIVDILGTL